MVPSLTLAPLPITQAVPLPITPALSPILVPLPTTQAVSLPITPVALSTITQAVPLPTLAQLTTQEISKICWSVFLEGKSLTMVYSTTLETSITVIILPTCPEAPFVILVPSTPTPRITGTQTQVVIS